jgi:integrase
VLRRALRKDLNQGGHAGELDEAEAKAITWIARASRPVSALQDPSLVCDVLDALAVNLNGKPAAPEYFSRRRRLLHRVLGYAVRKKRLSANPLSKGNLPEGWTPPQAPDGTLDPRAVGSPALVADMLRACGTIGRRQGPRFRAFYGCMFYALMRPSEVAALTLECCHLPAAGWGHLTFADSSPAPGKAYTDDGQVHEHRGLKGRTRGRPTPSARRPVRKVPIPPELVELLRAHIAAFGTARDGRLFRSERGTPLQPSTWWQVWQKVRAASLIPEQLASPLMKRPYDLRHSGVTWRLNSGVPATEVAAWAGHSVEVLTRVYARCVVGLEGVWIGRMDKALHLGEDR